MKKPTFFKKNLLLLTSGFILLNACGCSNKNKEEKEISNDTSNQTGNYIEYNYDNFIDETQNGYNKETTSTYIGEKKEEVTEIFTDIEEVKDNNDKVINEYFSIEKENIKILLQNYDFQAAKDKAKELIKIGIDFIFFDKSIHGITFNDITEVGKKVTYANLSIIDSWIIEIDPNYKEDLSDKYCAVSEFISEKYFYLNEEIKEYINEENYNALIDIKEKIKNSLEGEYQKSKEKTKEWYNNKFN